MLDYIYLPQDVRNPRFAQGHIGELYDRIAKELIDSPMLNTGGSRFRLLGVSSAFSAKFVGVKPDVFPPPTNRHLVFNFELLGRKKRGIQAIYRESNSVLMSGRDKLDTLAIGLSSTDCTELGLKTDPTWLNFLLRCVGVATISLSRNRLLYSDQPYVYERPVRDYFNKFWSMAPNMLYNSPMKFWVFNKEMWLNCMMLSPKMITETTALFYWAYVWDKVQVNRNSYMKVIKPQLVSFLEDSFRRMRQSNKAGAWSLQSPQDLIAPVVLHRLFNRATTTDVNRLRAFLTPFEGQDDAIVTFEEQLEQVIAR